MHAAVEETARKRERKRRVCNFKLGARAPRLHIEEVLKPDQMGTTAADVLRGH
jgi:hypothetical protein